MNVYHESAIQKKSSSSISTTIEKSATAVQGTTQIIKRLDIEFNV